MSSRRMVVVVGMVLCAASLALLADSASPAAGGSAVKVIASFEGSNPFAGDGASVVADHATDGAKALKIASGFASMEGKQDWTGFDYLKADVFVEGAEGVKVVVEIRDKDSKDYYTRVNYTTMVPAGKSTLVIPIKQLYVGEKSRPGRMLEVGSVTRLVFGLDGKGGPLFLDNIRLERDEEAAKAVFDGLKAFDFQPKQSDPVLEGFTAVIPTTVYSKEKGFGLKDAQLGKGDNVLQPEPLYQDYICITKGGFAVDVPNGKYHVWLNVNRPAAFWGETQRFTKRTILAQGKPVVNETMTDEMAKKRFFRFWNIDDLPTDNTFDKYQKGYEEKEFDVEVANGQILIEFQGDNDACDVSAMVIYPAAKAEQGKKFMKYVEDRRRFNFDNYFKRDLHKPTGDALAATEADKKQGFVAFGRDTMKDLYYNDTPAKAEIGKPVTCDVFAGESAPLAVAVLPLQDLGAVTVTASELKSDAGTIPASDINVGYVSYRINRVTMEGTVYTIVPRLIMPSATVDMPKDITREFWLTLNTPADVKSGLYKGQVTIKAAKGGSATVPVEVKVRAGTLDEVDIPAGPWGMDVTYVSEEKCMQKIRELGFTDFTVGACVPYKGFKDGKPQLDFTRADKIMAQAKALKFKGVIFYGSMIRGFNAYFQDTKAMQAAGFSDYSEFIKAVFTAVQNHATEQGWITYYVNLGDEPIGEDVVRAAENAEAYRKAFPKGPPFFTFATSFTGDDKASPHYRLSKALHAPALNGHDEPAVNALKEAGSAWAFYNGGNRWTFGDYMYKAAKQYGMVFRLSWHWYAGSGDPYYALDGREDDYAWCMPSPDGNLFPTMLVEPLRAGLGDYRRLLTLARLAKEKAGTPAADAATKLIDARMASFKLGQREHDALFGPTDWNDARAKVNDAIEALRK